jgi:Mrp family chromosome partitioning ATPase
MLAEKAGFEVIFQIPQFPKLSVLPAGTRPPNPQDLLGRPMLSWVLHEATDSFDVVLVDTHPCSANADALAVVAQVKGALIVVRKERSSMEATRRVVTQITDAGAQVIGSALNEF